MSDATHAGAGPTLTVPAYAKINLTLEVLGRRDDGFHEIASIVQLVSLADELAYTPAADFQIAMSPPLVTAEENLVRRAAELLAEAAGQQPRGHLSIVKRIPLAAGLGGGSSDAAAALGLLNHAWGKPLAYHQLARLAPTLGSDVSLFLAERGTTIMRGRGEHVESTFRARPLWVVLFCPGGAPADKTRALYRALRPADFSHGLKTLNFSPSRLAGQTSLDASLVNAFDRAANQVYPGFAELRARLVDAIGQPVHLTGAGPSLFALCEDRRAADRAAGQASQLDLPTFVARTVATRPPIRESRPPADHA
ncbi:MAG: 4-(cytidine 5'-diphospho)-2-C-methyl-D-erythritol kinase [Chloroflexota bacterium]